MNITDAEILFGTFDFNTEGMDKVKSALDSGKYELASEKTVLHFKTRTKPSYFYDALKKEKQLEIVLADENYCKSIVDEADRIMGVLPELYGYKVDFENPYVWNFAAYGANFTYGSMINRFEWLINVAKAYWITGDDKYPEFFVRIINHWNTLNPLKFEQALVRGQGTGGLAWNNSIDIGLRLKSFVQLFSYFRCWDGWDNESYITFLKMIYEHSRILYRQQGNLFGSNWQTQECEGLSHAAIMFPEFKDSGKWYDISSLRFLQHTSYLLTKEDGTYHEPTPGYFGGVRGHLFSFALLSELNGIEPDKDFMKTVERMFVWFMEMTMSDGFLPKVGDTSPYDDRIWMALGAALFRNGELKYVSGYDKLPTQHIWLVPREYFDGFELICPRVPEKNSTGLKNCKYFILRNSRNIGKDGNCLFFDVNPTIHGHNHFDFLNIEAVFDGERLLTESAHLGYGHIHRLNYVVAPIGHNILMIDNGKVQEIWPVKVLPEVTACNLTGENDYVEGMMVYNPGKDDEISWKRAVVYLKPDIFLVCDSIYGSGTHKTRRLFHTSCDFDIELISKNKGALVCGKTASCYVIGNNEDNLIVSTDDGMEMFDGKNPVAVFEEECEFPFRTYTAIANGKYGYAPQVKKITNGVRIIFGEVQWEVLFNENNDEYICVEKTDLREEVKCCD